MSGRIEPIREIKVLAANHPEVSAKLIKLHGLIGDREKEYNPSATTHDEAVITAYIEGIAIPTLAVRDWLHSQSDLLSEEDVSVSMQIIVSILTKIHVNVKKIYPAAINRDMIFKIHMIRMRGSECESGSEDWKEFVQEFITLIHSTADEFTNDKNINKNNGEQDPVIQTISLLWKAKQTMQYLDRWKTECEQKFDKDEEIATALTTASHKITEIKKTQQEKLDAAFGIINAQAVKMLPESDDFLKQTMLFIKFAYIASLHGITINNCKPEELRNEADAKLNGVIEKLQQDTTRLLLFDLVHGMLDCILELVIRKNSNNKACAELFVTKYSQISILLNRNYVNKINDVNKGCIKKSVWLGQKALFYLLLMLSVDKLSSKKSDVNCIKLIDEIQREQSDDADRLASLARYVRTDENGTETSKQWEKLVSSIREKVDSRIEYIDHAITIDNKIQTQLAIVEPKVERQIGGGQTNNQSTYALPLYHLQNISESLHVHRDVLEKVKGQLEPEYRMLVQETINKTNVCIAEMRANIPDLKKLRKNQKKHILEKLLKLAKLYSDNYYIYDENIRLTELQRVLEIINEYQLPLDKNYNEQILDFYDLVVSEILTKISSLDDRKQQPSAEAHIDIIRKSVNLLLAYKQQITNDDIRERTRNENLLIPRLAVNTYLLMCLSYFSAISDIWRGQSVGYIINSDWKEITSLIKSLTVAEFNAYLDRTHTKIPALYKNENSCSAGYITKSNSFIEFLEALNALQRSILSVLKWLNYDHGFSRTLAQWAKGLNNKLIISRIIIIADLMTFVERKKKCC